MLTMEQLSIAYSIFGKPGMRIHWDQMDLTGRSLSSTARIVKDVTFLMPTANFLREIEERNIPHLLRPGDQVSFRNLNILLYLVARSDVYLRFYQIRSHVPDSSVRISSWLIFIYF